MMNKVFIATSLDGFIADELGAVDFLYKYPDTPGEDMGYPNFIASIDALLMGRKSPEQFLQQLNQKSIPYKTEKNTDIVSNFNPILSKN